MASRNTKQQEIVAEHLAALPGHVTAEEVYASVHAAHPSISKATVYRVLNKMAASSKAIKIPVSGGADRFETATQPHCHIVCSICGRVDDVMLDPSLDGIDEIAQRMVDDYKISGHELQFFGVCKRCQQAALNA